MGAGEGVRAERSSAADVGVPSVNQSVSWSNHGGTFAPEWRMRLRVEAIDQNRVAPQGVSKQECVSG